MTRPGNDGYVRAVILAEAVLQRVDQLLLFGVCADRRLYGRNARLVDAEQQLSFTARNGALAELLTGMFAAAGAADAGAVTAAGVEAVSSTPGSCAGLSDAGAAAVATGAELASDAISTLFLCVKPR